MADLLECMVQLRALAETPRRLHDLLARHGGAAWTAPPPDGGPSPRELTALLAAEEPGAAAWVRRILAEDHPHLAVEIAVPEGGADPEAAAARFAAAREATLALLTACSAAQLERAGEAPGRGALTLADLAADLLARDTERLGRIRALVDSGGP